MCLVLLPLLHNATNATPNSAAAFNTIQSSVGCWIGWLVNIGGVGVASPESKPLTKSISAVPCGEPANGQANMHSHIVCRRCSGCMCSSLQLY